MPRLLLLLALPLILGLLVFNILGQPINLGDKSRLEFVISPGQSVDQISANLSQAKLIRSRTAFKLIVFRYNLGPKLQAGYFYLSPAQGTKEIAFALTKAATKQIWITLPEGLRRQEIANLILDRLQAEKVKHNFDPEAFIRLTANLEGRLYPDTYAFNPDVTTEQVLDRLSSQFDAVIKRLFIEEKDLDRILILASIVEKEAGNDEERPEIAGILTNRLNDGWPLQADATVQFAVGSARCRLRICDWWPKELSKADLAIGSPYNTYTNPGLPPGPITSPGEASLKAALQPNTTSNWFYLHDAEGQVHYAVTAEEHNQNVCTFLKKDC